MTEKKQQKIAIVYDWIDKWGGVERALLTLHETFPKAEFFTSYYDPETASWAKDLKIHTSFLQKFPDFIKKRRILSFPFYPYAFESFDFSGYDLVISVSSSFAKSVITRPGTIHVCYLLTPTRYFWIEPEIYLNGWRKIGKIFLPYLRKWDFVVAQRPDEVISISKTVQQRTKKFYRRESEVVYPPFDEEYWKKLTFEISHHVISNEVRNLVKRKYFLIVSRLETYKRIDIAVNTFNLLPHLNLIVVGTGSEEAQLKSFAKKNISFLKNITDNELAALYKSADALVMPQSEDFGYVALEAQYFGCPVISFKGGGSRETIVEDVTGIFFEKQHLLSLKAAIERFTKVSYNLRKSTAKLGVDHVKKFSKKEFIKSFMLHVTRYTNI